MSKYTKPGAILPNGAVVVVARQASPNRTIVLALAMGQAAHPYVTWLLDPETGTTYHGDYTLTFEGAIRSFAARSGFPVELLGDGVEPPEALAKDVTPDA